MDETQRNPIREVYRTRSCGSQLDCGEAIHEIYLRLLAGDRSQRDVLIIAAQRLVKLAVGRFIERNYDARYLREDLHSEGTLALIQAVDVLCDGRSAVENVAGYLRLQVKSACRDYFDNDGTVGSGKSTKSNRRRAGLDSKDKPCVPISACDDLPSDERQAVLYRLLSLCETEEERQIVRLRAERMTDAQIGNTIGLTQQTINRRRQKIECRYDAACHSLGA